MALILSGDTGVPASGMPTGSVIQTVSANYGTYPTNTTSTSFVTTGHSLTITPTASTSKIYLVLHFQAYTSAASNGGNFTIYRNGSNINTNGFAEFNLTGSWLTLAINYLDSPASTSAQTYTVYYKSQNGGTLYYCGNTNEYCVLTAMEIKQ